MEQNRAKLKHFHHRVSQLGYVYSGGLQNFTSSKCNASTLTKKKKKILVSAHKTSFQQPADLYI